MIYSIKSFGLTATALLAAVVPGAGLADSGRNFTVTNTNAKVSIQRVWTARDGEAGDPWHEVTLSYPIKPNTTSNFTMGDGDVCLYDIKVQFSDNVVQQFANVNVCRGQTVTAT